MGVPLEHKLRTDLDVTIAGIHERFGPDVLYKLEKPDSADIPHLSTGFPGLDKALGIGGIPRGHITELVGMPTSGMRTLALKVIASAHAVGDMAAYIDLSRTFDADYAVRCGVDISNLLLVRPVTLNEAVDMAYSFIANRSLGVLVWDLPTGQSNILSLAKLLSPLAQSACACICLSCAWDAPQNTKLAQQAVLRLRITRQAWLKRRRAVRGYRTQVAILKNKFSPLRREVSVTIGFSGAVAGDGA